LSFNAIGNWAQLVKSDLTCRLSKNDRSLCHHPELKKMIPELMIALLKDKPKEVLPYGVVFFTSSQIESDYTFSDVQNSFSQLKGSRTHS
jgi:hypothetical protein